MTYECLASSWHSFLASHSAFTKPRVSSDASQSVTGSPSSEGHILSDTRPQNAYVTAILAPSRQAIYRFSPVQIVIVTSEIRDIKRKSVCPSSFCKCGVLNLLGFS